MIRAGRRIIQVCIQLESHYFNHLQHCSKNILESVGCANSEMFAQAMALNRKITKAMKDTPKNSGLVVETVKVVHRFA